MVGRPRKFDEQVALGQAMHTFWRQGYHSTTLDHLTQAMALNRPSLYNTFGDKHTLFLTALDRYVGEVFDQAVQRLRAPGSPREAIVSTLRWTAERHLADDEHKGCLVLNTALEWSVQDDDVARRVQDILVGIENAFEDVVRRAQEAGEIDPSRDPRALARFLTSSLHGLHVLARTGREREVFDGVLDGITHALR